jgi:hypothetical protein
MREHLARSLPLATLIVIGSAAAAEAGPWYYTWSCAGDCAPGQLTIEGREGPFLSRADCEYARDHDRRAVEFVEPGNLGGLASCEEDTSVGATYVAVPATPHTPSKVRMASVELGLAFGPGWRTTSDGGGVTDGPATVGVEVDAHTGRDLGGGSMQLGLYGTWVEAPMLGESPRAVVVLPLAIGLVLTPQVYHRGARSLRLDVGASAGGFFLFGCSDCGAPVFDETLAFGYTLKAGLDLYLSSTTGFSLDVVFPRWQIGTAASGDLMLESPTWMLRLSAINRPAP